MTAKALTAATAALAWAALAWATLAVGSPAFAQAKKPAAAAAAASKPVAAPAVDYAEGFRTVCAACHGAEGRSDQPGVPVLAGQHSFYAITQLFLFREGRRHNEGMIVLAKQMKDADLRGYADYIGTLPPIPAPPPAEPPDAVRMSKGQALAREHKCTFCHGPALDGGQQVPRIGGQKEEYVLQTLRDLKSGARPGYTRAMTEALSQVPVEDFEVLAYYVANFVGK